MEVNVLWTLQIQEQIHFHVIHMEQKSETIILLIN